MPERVAKTAEQALLSLMQQCSRAEKSSGDALRLMARWGVDPAKREEVLQRLIKDRFIDDNRYAQAFIKEKSRLNGWGEYKIKNGLRSKGISTDIITVQMATLSKEDCTNKLDTMLRRRVRSIKESDQYKLKTKLLRYGLSLGYDYDSVTEILEKIINEREIERDEFL